MNPAELLALANRLRYACRDPVTGEPLYTGQSSYACVEDVEAAARYLRDCAYALDVGPVAWAATDETGKIVEALGMNRTHRFSDPLYLRPLPAQAQALRLPEPMTDEAIYDNAAILAANRLAGLLFGDFATVVRAIEAEVLRRVKEANE